MPEKLYVAAKAWIEREGQTLILRDENGGWDLPGGRIDESEFARIPFHDVLARELREEVGLTGVRGVLVGYSQWIRPPRPGEHQPLRVFVLHFSVAAPAGFEPTLSTEHLEKRWVDNPCDFLPEGLCPEHSS